MRVGVGRFEEEFEGDRIEFRNGLNLEAFSTLVKDEYVDPDGWVERTAAAAKGKQLVMLGTVIRKSTRTPVRPGFRVKIHGQ